MIGKWLDRFFHWLRSQRSPAPTPPTPDAVLEHYRQAMESLGDNPNTLLSVLLTRDQVEVSLQKARSFRAEHIQQLVALDEQLRKQWAVQLSEDLSAWRETVHPPDTAWWWFLDRGTEREKESDLPWVLLTGTMVTLTLPLALEIIKRFWDGAPDTLSVFGTLLTLLITGSPLFRRGQEVGRWFLQRIPWLKPRVRAEAIASMAGLALVAVLVGRLWLLPPLAVFYNNRGHADLQVGNLTAAQRAFQRAVALDPDQVVPYQNLADVYQRIGRPQEAMAWYQKAIERDLNFGAAYSGLGHLHNSQGEFAQAEKVLLAGLACTYNAHDTALETVTRYQLLADLGWSYFAQERLDRAQETLEAAIALEGELKVLGEQRGAEYRLALPHYYLAQVYEQSGRPQDAIRQWEDSLRYLDQENWADRDWIATALSHLQELEAQE